VKAYFMLAMEWRFGADSGPSRSEPLRARFRPTEPFAVATHDVRFTSTPARWR
jgi:hypothetical protein